MQPKDDKSKQNNVIVPLNGIEILGFGFAVKPRFWNAQSVTGSRPAVPKPVRNIVGNVSRHFFSETWNVGGGRSIKVNLRFRWKKEKVGSANKFSLRYISTDDRKKIGPKRARAFAVL